MLFSSAFTYGIMCGAIQAATALAMARPGNGDIAWGSLRCPRDLNDNTTTLPTPTYGTAERVFMICAELVIDTPPAAVYAAVLDFKRYHLWNSFVVDVALPPNVTVTPRDVYIGMEMNFTVAGLGNGTDANMSSDEVVTVLDGPGELHRRGYLMAAWRSNVFFGGELDRAEHPSILTEAGPGRTRYVSYETYYGGVATPLILPLRPQLQTEFEQQGLDLKAYVEGLCFGERTE